MYGKRHGGVMTAGQSRSATVVDNTIYDMQPLND